MAVAVPKTPIPCSRAGPDADVTAGWSRYPYPPLRGPPTRVAPAFAFPIISPRIKPAPAPIAAPFQPLWRKSPLLCPITAPATPPKTAPWTASGRNTCARAGTNANETKLRRIAVFME